MAESRAHRVAAVESTSSGIIGLELDDAQTESCKYTELPVARDKDYDEDVADYVRITAAEQIEPDSSPQSDDDDDEDYDQIHPSTSRSDPHRFVQPPRAERGVRDEKSSGRVPPPADDDIERIIVKYYCAFMDLCNGLRRDYRRHCRSVSGESRRESNALRDIGVVMVEFGNSLISVGTSTGTPQRARAGVVDCGESNAAEAAGRINTQRRREERASGEAVEQQRAADDEAASGEAVKQQQQQRAADDKAASGEVVEQQQQQQQWAADDEATSGETVEQQQRATDGAASGEDNIFQVSDWVRPTDCNAADRTPMAASWTTGARNSFDPARHYYYDYNHGMDSRSADPAAARYYYDHGMDPTAAAAALAAARYYYYDRGTDNRSNPTAAAAAAVTARYYYYDLGTDSRPYLVAPARYYYYDRGAESRPDPATARYYDRGADSLSDPATRTTRCPFCGLESGTMAHHCRHNNRPIIRGSASERPHSIQPNLIPVYNATPGGIHRTSEFVEPVNGEERSSRHYE